MIGRFATVLTTIAIAAFGAMCQQTIFNVPSADILDRGSVYAELDVSAKPNSQNEFGRFSSAVPRIVAGVGHGVEVGINLNGNVQPGPDSTTIATAVKWRPLSSKDGRATVYTGTTLFVPIRNRAYRAGAFVYAAASGSFGKTRVAAGPYVFTRDVVAARAARGGMIASVEQTVNKRFSLAADWISGRHSAGYLTTGGVIKATPRLTLYIAYSVANSGASRGNHFALFEFGYNF